MSVGWLPERNRRDWIEKREDFGVRVALSTSEGGG